MGEDTLPSLASQERNKTRVKTGAGEEIKDGGSNEAMEKHGSETKQQARKTPDKISSYSTEV
jgi:hypothetical protein